MKTIEVALPNQLHARILSIAKDTRKPATEIVERAVERGLAMSDREARHQAILEYARRNAGSGQDLDTALESATIECLLSPDAQP